MKIYTLISGPGWTPGVVAINLCKKNEANLPKQKGDVPSSTRLGTWQRWLWGHKTDCIPTRDTLIWTIHSLKRTYLKHRGWKMSYLSEKASLQGAMLVLGRINLNTLGKKSGCLLVVWYVILQPFHCPNSSLRISEELVTRYSHHIPWNPGWFRMGLLFHGFESILCGEKDNPLYIKPNNQPVFSTFHLLCAWSQFNFKGMVN